MKKTTIYIGADHAGWEMKAGLEEYLKNKNYNVIDMGNKDLVEDDDYPDFGYAVAKRIIADKNSKGVVICGNAQGVCIVSNKVKGIRAATVFNTDVAKTSRTDDDSNILCLPARHLEIKEAKKITDTWLETSFSGEDRHVRRLEKVSKIENQEFKS